MCAHRYAPLYGNGRAEKLIAQAFHTYGARVTTLTKILPFNYHWAPAPGTPINDIYPPEYIVVQVEECRIAMMINSGVEI